MTSLTLHRTAVAVNCNKFLKDNPNSPDWDRIKDIRSMCKFAFDNSVETVSLSLEDLKILYADRF